MCKKYSWRFRLLNLVALLFLAISWQAGIQAQSEKPVKPTQKPPAQKPEPKPQEDQDEPVRLTSRLVMVPVSVTDQAGQPIKDLTAADFVIDPWFSRRRGSGLGL